VGAELESHSVTQIRHLIEGKPYAEESISCCILFRLLSRIDLKWSMRDQPNRLEIVNVLTDSFSKCHGASESHRFRRARIRLLPLSFFAISLEIQHTFSFTNKWGLKITDRFDDRSLPPCFLAFLVEDLDRCLIPGWEKRWGFRRTICWRCVFFGRCRGLRGVTGVP